VIQVWVTIEFKQHFDPNEVLVFKAASGNAGRFEGVFCHKETCELTDVRQVTSN
jgi:hypothetical protein